MTNTKPRTPHRPLAALLAGLLLALALPLALGGCAQNAKPGIPSAEDQLDAWKAMEKQAQGHSPRGSIQATEPSTVVDRPTGMDKARSDEARALPGMRISLRMHNADVVAVIQALSRAAGLSIVVSPGVSGTLNVNIVERPWSEVFKGILAANRLAYSFEGDTIRVMAAPDLQGTVELEGLKRKAQAERLAMLREQPLVTSIASVRFSDAKNLQKTIEKNLSRDKDGKAIGSVDVDEYTNSLVIQAIEGDTQKIQRVLARLDAPRAQIKLKAHIVETTKEVARELGIMWGGMSSTKMGGGSNSNLFLIPGGTTSDTANKYNELLGGGIFKQGWASNYPASSVAKNQVGTAMGLAFGNPSGNILEMQLQALAKDNKLNIISSPSIATMDNQKAYTESGERVPYQTVTGTGTSATTSVEFQDALLKLEITPHVIDDQFIRLDVLVQKDEVDTSRSVSGNPYIVKKKTETTLIARNGETVVISGLSKLRNEDSEAGLPGVKDVPGLGWLAKSQYKRDLKDEYMIFITPTVLEDWKAGERQKSIEELKREADEAKEAARIEAERAERARGAVPQPAQQQGGRP